LKHLVSLVEKTEDLSFPAATIQTLAEFSQRSQGILLIQHIHPKFVAKTMAEFIQELEKLTTTLKEEVQGTVSVVSGCELFMRFVTRMAADSCEDLTRFKRRLIDNSLMFAEKSIKGREKIAELAYDFIQDGSVVLCHCHSRVVLTLLLNAAKHNRRFSVYVTEARPTLKGYEAARMLTEAGISAKVIFDSAVGYYMEKVDLVLVGAEGVVENGGIINQVRHIVCPDYLLSI
jgi:translation initiation factor eIF-2B subunit alpha